MAERTYAAIDGVPCRVLVESPGERGYEPVGQQGRAASGAWRSSVFDWKRRWSVVASLQSIGDRDRLIAKLTSGGSLTCEGEVFGDSGSGSPTHSRSSTARYKDSQGVLQSAASGVLRDKHWVENESGVSVPSYLLEGARTNGWTWSEDFGNSGDAAWTKLRATITDDATTAPDGTSTMDKLVEDGTASNSHYLRRDTPSLTDGTNSTVSCFAKDAERDWLAIQTVNKGGTAVTSWFNVRTGETGTLNHASGNVEIREAGHGSFRIRVTFGSGSGGTTPQVRFMLADSDGSVSYSGDSSSGLYIWGIQFETDQPHMSSYMKTEGSTTTRTADSLYFDFTADPQAMTVYLKFVEQGTILTGGLRLVHIGSATGTTDPRFNVLVSSSNYTVDHDNGTATSAVSLSDTPSIGDVVEIAARLHSDGHVSILQSRNGGTVSSAEDATTATLAEAWADTRFYLNSRGSSNTGFNAFIGPPKIASGVQTMGHMRTLETPDLFPGPTVGKVSAYCSEFGGTTPTQVAGGLRHEVRFTLEEA